MAQDEPSTSNPPSPSSTPDRDVASRYDAVVVGSGPNGLAAAITLARAGWSVLVVEAADQAGGGLRSAALTLPGFVHDVCSSVHPLAIASPFFRSLPLADLGVFLDHAPAPLAHPLDDGTAAVLHRDLSATANTLGRDADAYMRLMAPLVNRARPIVDQVVAPPPVLSGRLPTDPLALAVFARHAPRSAEGLARSRFTQPAAKALHAGSAAHAIQPLSKPVTAALGLLLGLLGHASGWPVARGGSQRIADGLVAHLTRLGGHVVTGWRVQTLDELPGSDAVLFDLTPRQVLAIAGHRFPSPYRRRLQRYRYGPGSFKVDWALEGPVPWTAPECHLAGTLHLGGTLEEIAAAEEAAARGRVPERPFVLFAQPAVADPSRAPANQHTAWAYCHVPNGSPVDMTKAIEAQVERFAPGFRDRILATHVMSPAALESHNANYAGGDINGGVLDVRQLLTRPTPRLPLYSTPDPRLWFCSSSTPPAGGVHGMCGVGAAEAVLRRAGRRLLRT